MSGLFSSKTISNSENRLGALNVQQSSQGVPVALVFGTTRIAPNLIGYYDFTAIPHTESQEAGKGGGTTVRNTTYTYTVSPMFALCEGPVQNASFVGTIWSGKELTDTAKLGATQFQGTYSQNAWSYLLSAHANEALNYRGQCYVAVGNMDLGNSNGLPNLNFEVTGFGENDGGDESPAYVLTELLTNVDYGAGFLTAYLGDLTAWRTYCEQAGIAISPAIVAQRMAAEITTELAMIGNAAPVWSEGVLKIIPYADEAVGSFTPDLTVQYALTNDDFLGEDGAPPVKVRRKRQADAFNQVQIECLDRDNDYNSHVADAKDQWNIDVFGLRPMEVISAHAICDVAVAQRVGQAKLQRVLYVRNEYEFELGWRYARLEPMDIVSLTEVLLGLDELLVRITSVEENEEGRLTIVAEDMQIGSSSPGVYTHVSGGGGTGAVNTGIDPGDADAPVMFQPPLAMTGGVPQIWIGSSGGPNWGGAQIWVSTNDDTYEQAGTLRAPARHGVLSANLPSHADPDTSNTLAVDLSASNGSLTTVTAAAADALATLSYVGANATTEIVAYSAANLTSPYNYDLDTYLRRALVGSLPTTHASGSKFMRLDDAVARINVPPSLFGTTIYVKLLSFNKTGGGIQALEDVTAYPFAVAAQVLSDGSGYAYIADLNSTSSGPASGRLRWNNANQAVATALYLSDTTADGANVSAYLASLGNTGFVELRDPADTAKWATYQITASAAANASYSLTVAVQANGVKIPHGDTVMVKFSPTGVRGIGLVMPATIFTVTNSPITTTGNLTVSMVAQNASTFLAGPLTGNACTPAFRAFALTDIPVGSNTQVLTTSNGVVVWANAPAGGGGGSANMAIRTVSANTTLVVTDSSNAVEYNSSSAGQIIVPSNANAPFNIGSSVLLTQLGTGNFTVAAEANVTVLSSAGNVSWNQYSELALYKRATDEWLLTGERLAVLGGGNGGNGSVTSVGLVMPAIFSVANSPVTTTGNLTVSLANQSAGMVWAGPASGAAAAPTFRALVGADLGSQNAGTFLGGPASGNAANAAFRALAGGDMPRLTINTQTANYTLAASDANIAYVRMNSANATVVTVPPNANVPMGNGTSVLINRAGAGNVTFAAGAGVSVANSSSLAIRAQGATVALVKVGTDAWDLFGDLT
jgi:hypothetical protein